MPPFKESSETKPADSVLLQAWIHELIKTSQTNNGTGHMLRPVKEIIPKLTKSDLEMAQLSRNVLSNKSHFAKFTRFHRVKEFQVFGAIRDNEHQILS